MITKKDFVILTEQKNFKLVGGHEYTDSKTKYPIVCSCGNTWPINYTNLKTVKGCPKCKAKALKDRMVVGNQTHERLTTDEFKTRLKASRDDVTVVDGEVYQGSAKKLLVRCNTCSHEWPVRPHHIIGGSRCPECNKRAYDNESIDAKLVDDFGGITRLSDCSTPGEIVQFECSDGHTFWIKPAQLLNSDAVNKCHVCSKEQNNRGFKTDKNAWLYFATVIVNKTILYKVGITNRTPKSRVSSAFEKFYIYKEIEIHGKYALKVETYIKQKMRQYRAFQKGDPVDCMSGYTEVYTEEPMQFFTKEEITDVALGKNL
jgi:predicted Zn-ribbon and HTH transcriptional regulator